MNKNPPLYVLGTINTQGLCIGGPRDGEMYTSTRGPAFEAHIPGPMPLEPDYNAKITDGPVTMKMLYRYVPYRTGDEKHGPVEHGFWVPDEHYPVAHWYIVTELTKAYQQTKE